MAEIAAALASLHDEKGGDFQASTWLTAETTKQQAADGISRETIRKWGSMTEAKERRKEYYKEYAQRPEVKERRKALMKKYLQKPEDKERRKRQMKAYNQRSEVKEYQREYRLAKKMGEKMKKIVFSGIVLFLLLIGCTLLDEVDVNGTYQGIVEGTQNAVPFSMSINMTFIPKR